MTTDDFFRARLDTMIGMRHPLAELATRMPWAQIEASLAPAFAHRDRKGRLVERADLFGPSLALAGAGISDAGRPRLPKLNSCSIPPSRPSCRWARSRRASSNA